MKHIDSRRWRQGTALAWLVVVPFVAGQGHATAEQDALWDKGLKTSFFGDRPIVESDELIVLDAPKRAENAAVVPVAISARIPQTAERYIKTLWLIADRNPGPLAGKFTFSPASGRVDLELRIRLNEYTPLRAIAETSDGNLYMSRRFVKASGGCSAPAGSDIDAAMARLGKMKMKTISAPTAGSPLLTELMVSHPNINGLQMDQLTGLYMPAHFVKQVEVRFEGELVMTAETSFAISENPSFRFYVAPDREGELTAEVVDTEGLTFTHSHRISFSESTGAVAQERASRN